MSALVSEPSAVAEIARELAESPLVTFDVEFLAQDRLVPTLCLVQVSWLRVERLDVPAAVIVAAPPEVRLVDAIAVDTRPIFEVLAVHPRALAHAVRQDLAIVATRFGIAMPNVLDTQVMAAFAGVGDQVGLGQLANELLGLALEKGSQWTDWARRPLSDAQLAYADADVRHLPAIYAKLAARLGDRIKWASAESSVVAAEALAAASVTPETAWRNLGGLNRLDANALAAAKQLAAWRQRVAAETDKPLGWVLNERTIMDLAKQRPMDEAEVRAAKGISNVAKQRAGELVAAIAAAKPEAIEPFTPTRAPSIRAQRWSELLVAIAQIASDQTGVAVRLLATRSDAEEFARLVDERGIEAAKTLPACTTWRREILGELWVAWLEGKLALVGDTAAPIGFRLLPR